MTLGTFDYAVVVTNWIVIYWWNIATLGAIFVAKEGDTES